MPFLWARQLAHLHPRRHLQPQRQPLQLPEHRHLRNGAEKPIGPTKSRPLSLEIYSWLLGKKGLSEGLAGLA